MPMGPCCHTCLYSFWDKGLWMTSLSTGFPHWPVCANHPDHLGQMRTTPAGGPCRNYRPRPEEPARGAVQIPLGDGAYAYVDAADLEWLSQYNWRLQNGYAARREKQRVIYMHREIMKPPRGKTVDHKNRNRLDNTRDNLRVCTRQQNTHNNCKHMGSVSRFKGVGYSKDREKWFAKAYFEGERIWLGYHVGEEDAARAYDATAVELFGEFAHLNFPEEWPPQRRAKVRAQRDAAKRKSGKGRRAEGKKVRRSEGRKVASGNRRTTSDKGRATKKSEKPRRTTVPKKSHAGTQRRRDRKGTSKSKRAVGHEPRATAAKGHKKVGGSEQ